MSLRVAIDAHITPGSGGVAQAIIGLVHALGKLTDGAETYVIVVGSRRELILLHPFIGSNQQLIVTPRSLKVRIRGFLKRALGPFASKFWKPQLSVPSSVSFYGSLGCHVVHFPHQNYALCGLPTIYNPHDLQHLYYPQFFTVSEISKREMVYRVGCDSAHTVVVASQWVREDLIRQYRVSPGKVQVIPWGPPTQAYPEPSLDHLFTVREKYHLVQPFVFYPAVTWPHKNHIRLLEALAYLRDRHSMLIRLVCTGSLADPSWLEIRKCIHRLALGPQAKFLGFVPEEDMRAIYRLSQFIVVPTLFESDSFPIYEAWLDGVPVACSNVTSLPDQVLDAALVFDPNRVESIAGAVANLAMNLGLQRELRKRGYQRLKDFDWERTAKAYRALYRRAAGQPLSAQDRQLLSWDWMREPRRTDRWRSPEMQSSSSSKSPALRRSACNSH